MDRTRIIKSVGIILALFMGFFLLIPSANAQYFGQNKVRYQSFNFKILKTEHFDVYYYPVEEEAAKQAARIAMTAVGRILFPPFSLHFGKAVQKRSDNHKHQCKNVQPAQGN